MFEQALAETTANFPDAEFKKNGYIDIADMPSAIAPALSGPFSFFRDLTQRERLAWAAGFVDGALDDAPARDVRVYRDDEEAKRSRDAQARFDGVMIVASSLAKHLGESIASEDIRSDQRVGVLVNGWWANNFTVLPAMQRVLQTKVPSTAQRMSDERVFRDPAPANELIERFKELSDLGRGEPVASPKPKVTVLGQEKAADDVVNDLLHGTAGDIGRMLKEKAALQPLDPNLGKGIRGKVVLKPKSREGGGGGGGGGGPDNAKDRELVGLLGEAFAYENFRLTLPGFDEMSWRSCNRSAYGLEGEGNDALGYDFLYRDIENKLGGRDDRPLCCIEVKASFGGGSESFPMTANEWDKARECHQTAESLYIIVRVANVRDDPRITDVVIDPFGLYGDGQVAVVSRDIWVYVGEAQSESGEFVVASLTNLTVSLKTMYCRRFFDCLRRSDECESAI